MLKQSIHSVSFSDGTFLLYLSSDVEAQDKNLRLSQDVNSQNPWDEKVESLVFYEPELEI